MQCGDECHLTILLGNTKRFIVLIVEGSLVCFKKGCLIIQVHGPFDRFFP